MHHARAARGEGRLDQALSDAAWALGLARSNAWRHAAADELALVHLASGDVDAARAVLEANVHPSRQEPLTIAAIAFGEGRPEDTAAVLLAERARGERRAESTRLLSDALVTLGREREAIAIVVEDAALLTAPELASVRDFIDDRAVPRASNRAASS